MANVTNWENVPVTLDVPLIARILGKTPDNISRRCQRGDLNEYAFKDGREWRMRKERLIEYIEAQEAKNRILKPEFRQAAAR